MCKCNLRHISQLGIFVDRIYPFELEIKGITDTDRSASYLDLHLEIDMEGRLRTKLYDKRDDFNVPVVNFLFICNNIPASPAYEVYISHCVRYSRVCGFYTDFPDRGLKSSLRKFYRRHHDLVNRCGMSVSQMIMDMFHLSKTLPGPFMTNHLSPDL
jgi:hypothetical protein